VSLWLTLLGPWLLAGAVTCQRARLADRFHPRWMVRVTASTCVLLAVSTWTSAFAAGAVLLVHSGGIAHAAGWVVGGFAVAAVLVALRHTGMIRASMRAGRIYRLSTCKRDDVLVVDDQLAAAFAVPGRGGCVVLTTALLSELTSAERRALLAHERAHLMHHHHLYTQAVELSACLNPLLSPWRAVVRFAAERDADECAAMAGRSAAVSALARASLLCAPAGRAVGAGITGRPSDVRRRLAALLREAPPPQRWSWIVAAILTAAALGVQAYLAADIAQDHIAPEAGEAGSVVVG
jgi:beta-lactamase regulating signal transducer with metallopeptidase domain